MIVSFIPNIIKGQFIKYLSMAWFYVSLSQYSPKKSQVSLRFWKQKTNPNQVLYDSF